jgi:hypothetical protein
MKLDHILFSLIGSASLSPTLAAAALDAHEAQIGITSNLGVVGLTRRSNYHINSAKTVDREHAVDSAAKTCKTYDDCVRCKRGYWRCCVAGCAGHEVPDSHTCLCIKDGFNLPPQCGCS